MDAERLGWTLLHNSLFCSTQLPACGSLAAWVTMKKLGLLGDDFPRIPFTINEPVRWERGFSRFDLRAFGASITSLRLYPNRNGCPVSSGHLRRPHDRGDHGNNLVQRFVYGEAWVIVEMLTHRRLGRSDDRFDSVYARAMPFGDERDGEGVDGVDRDGSDGHVSRKHLNSASTQGDGRRLLRL